MHTAILYIHGFLVRLTSLAGGGGGGGDSWRFLKVKSIMHEGPRAKPNSLKL